MDYTKQFESYKKKPADNSSKPAAKPSNEPSKLYDVLTQYRLLKSREEQIKPYSIYTNKQLDDLVSKLPRSKKDLLQVEGFGQVKLEKYGNDILHIIAQYLNYIQAK